MKRIMLLSIVLLFVTTLSAQRQKIRDSISNTYDREFVINPFSFFVGGFEIGYGKITANQMNLRGYLGYYFSENAASYNEEDNGTTNSNGIRKEFSNMEGVRAEFQFLKIKPVKDDFRFYYGGYAVFKTITMDVESTNTTGGSITTINYVAKGSALGAGLLFGMRNYVHENFFFDIYGGGGINISLNRAYEDDVHIPVFNPYKRAVTPRIGCSIGLAF